MKTTLDILWSAIKDIETGVAKTQAEDPVNGLLPENTKLTKINVSHQSAKYNNGKPISRPTIDSYNEIVSYIKGDNVSNSKDKDIIKSLKLANTTLQEQLKHITLLNQKLVEENRLLVEIAKNNKLS